jgi:hypothetical protein
VCGLLIDSCSSWVVRQSCSHKLCSQSRTKRSETASGHGRGMLLLFFSMLLTSSCDHPTHAMHSFQGAMAQPGVLPAGAKVCSQRSLFCRQLSLSLYLSLPNTHTHTHTHTHSLH